MKHLGWIVLASMATLGAAQDWDPFTQTPTQRGRPVTRQDMRYYDAIQRTAQMVGDSEAQRLAHRYGLNVLNVTWEDTGRYKGSAVGPNISDMTIQVGTQNWNTRRFEAACMPVIRFPNFSDVTGDIDPRDFTLMVGAERGGRLQRVSLYDYLADPTYFMSKPSSWRGSNRTLLADRDDKVLVSAQACFLPIPQQGKATFNPVLFNYQSTKGNPAVLTILATREGTSMTIIDNSRDAFPSGGVWGQRLFHNQNGMRASLTGERMSDFVSHGVSPSTATSSGLNMVLLIQVPLKYRERDIRPMDAQGAGGGLYKAGAAAESRTGSDVENAVIGHGALEGPFTEVDNLAIERDPRFPVRVTVQFYKATSNGIVNDQDMREIKQSIDSVYHRAENVGSLVTQGETGRPTEYWGRKVQPAHWWNEFWGRHERDTGRSREESIRKLRELLGRNYAQLPVCDLYVRDLLRKR